MRMYKYLIYKRNPSNFLTKYMHIDSISIDVSNKYYVVRVDFVNNDIPTFDGKVAIHPKGFFATLFGEVLPLHIQRILEMGNTTECINVIKRLVRTPILFVNLKHSVIAEDVISVTYGVFRKDKEYWVTYNDVPINELAKGADNYKPHMDISSFVTYISQFIHSFFSSVDNIDVGFIVKLGYADLAWRNHTFILEKGVWRYSTRKHEKVRSLLGNLLDYSAPEQDEVGQTIHTYQGRELGCVICRCIAKNDRCALWVEDRYVVDRSKYGRRFRLASSRKFIRVSMDGGEKTYEKPYSGMFAKFIDVPQDLKPLDVVHPDQIEFKFENNEIIAMPESVEVIDTECYRVEERYVVYFFKVCHGITKKVLDKYVATVICGRVILLHEDDPLRRKAEFFRNLCEEMSK